MKTDSCYPLRGRQDQPWQWPSPHIHSAGTWLSGFDCFAPAAVLLIRIVTVADPEVKPSLTPQSVLMHMMWDTIAPAVEKMRAHELPAS
jgi:hypothetical protein